MKREISLSKLTLSLQEKFFSESWLNVPDDQEAVESSRDLMMLNIVSASTEILKYYHLVLLNGDYICLIDNVHAEFLELERYLNEKNEEIESISDETLKLELQSKFQDNLLHVIKSLIKPSITYFIRDLTIQLHLEYKRGLFRGDKSENQNVDLDEGVINYMSSFKWLMTILSFEHFNYQLDNELKKRLLILREEVKILTIDSALKEAISLKTSFLLKKILYREEISKSRGSSPEFIYSFDQQDDIVLDSETVAVNSSLDVWDNLIKVHYGLSSDFKLGQRRRRKEIEGKPQDSYCYGDFHGLIKIFKDDTKNIEQTENLIDLFEHIGSTDKTWFGDYSRKCTGAYLYNNYISLKCESNKLDADDYKDVYFDIRNRQNKDDVRNYFPWLKLAQTLSTRIDKISSELVDPKKYSLFREYLELFSKVSGKLKEAVEWSINKKFVPIQMSFDECRSNYSIGIAGFEDVKLFFFSSFILPLDYKQVNKDRGELESKKLKYEALDSVYGKLQYVIQDVNESSEKMRKQERRSVEILAIFSAVALFSMGSIQIFSNGAVANDPHVYYRFIMAFGYSLSLFVLLIWIITRDNIKQVHAFHWVIVLLISIGTCVAIGYFVSPEVSK